MRLFKPLSGSYYLIHMGSAFFHVGLCYYVKAMQTDLKIRLQEIHVNIMNADGLVDRAFELSLTDVIKFHSCVFEYGNFLFDFL